jgi:hypothetical protein
MPHQSSPVRVPVDLLRLFFGPERVCAPIARLSVTWFLLAGGWEADFSDRFRNLRVTRLASWLWPPALWQLENPRVGPTATSVLLELQGLGIARVLGREGRDVLVELLRAPDACYLPDRIEAQLRELAARHQPGDAQ